MTHTTALSAPAGATELALRDARDQDIPKLAACPRLARLSLAGSYVTDAGLATLAGLGLRLEALELPAGHGITAAGLASVARIDSLKEVRAVSLNDLADASALARLPALETLELEGTKVGDETMVALAGAPALVALNVARTRITPKGLANLGGRALKLERLDARTLRVDADAMAALATLARLERLALNWLGDGAELASLRSLKELVVGTLKQSDPAVADWNKSENIGELRVHSLPRLQTLDMHQTNVQVLQLEDLPALTLLRVATSKLRKLSVARCAALAALDLQPQGHLNTLELEALPELASLDASRCIKLRKVFVVDVPKLAAPKLPQGVSVAAPRPAKRSKK